jgi:hypothetical protein
MKANRIMPRVLIDLFIDINNLRSSVEKPLIMVYSILQIYLLGKCGGRGRVTVYGS